MPPETVEGWSQDFRGWSGSEKWLLGEVIYATSWTSATRPTTMRVLQTRKDKGSVGSGMRSV